MSIKISDIVTDIPVISLAWYPGHWILKQEKNDLKKAERIFHNFIEQKIPLAKNLIEKLVTIHHP
jgi:hypothetical protein